MKRLKITLLWGVSLVIINTVVRTILATVLDENTAKMISIAFVPLSSVLMSFKGTLALRRVNLKDQDKIHPFFEGIVIVLVSNILGAIYLYFISKGETGPNFFGGLIWGLVGGVLAKRRIEVKPLLDFRLK